jgi:hypothetical protein
MLTISCSGRVSFSEVMSVLWIKNLSLHLAAVGGSSFKGCSITAGQVSQSRGEHRPTHQRRQHSPLALFCRSLAARNRATWSSDSEYIPSRTTTTLGAVTLTLKATGWALLFVTAKLRLTVTVSGPGKKLHGSNHPKPHYAL